MRRRDSARMVMPRVGCKSPRDRSPQIATVHSDTTKNHGAAFRPDIFQLHVNMIGGGRRCKSPPRRCSQHAHHTCIHIRIYTHTRATHTYVSVCDREVRCACTRVINRRQPQTTARVSSRESLGNRFVDTSIRGLRAPKYPPRRAAQDEIYIALDTQRSSVRNVCVTRGDTAVKRGCYIIVGHAVA